MRIFDGYYLIAWLFDDGMQAYALAESVDFAKQVVKDRLGVEPEWNDPPEGGAITFATLNIVHNNRVLQGVMIQPVPLYTMSEKQGAANEQT